MGNLFKFNKSGLSFKKTVKTIFRFWIERRRAFFIIISLAVFSLGIYFSYINLHRNPWNKEKRNQYVDSQKRDIDFKKDDFKRVIEEIGRKKGNFQKDFLPAKDIFKPLGE